VGFRRCAKKKEETEMPNKNISAQNAQGSQAENRAMKRYYVHDFLFGNPILLDRHEKICTFYNRNIHGQIYDLENAKPYKVSGRRITGLIRKLNNHNYSFKNGLVIDRYIYTYFLTDDQRAKCRRTADVLKWDTLIAESDNLHEAVRIMCEWVYENEYCGTVEEKDQNRERLMRYCDAYLGRLAA